MNTNIYLDIIKAAKELRQAQRNYMSNRGNEGLGKIVGERASELDVLLDKFDKASECEGLIFYE